MSKNVSALRVRAAKAGAPVLPGAEKEEEDDGEDIGSVDSERSVDGDDAWSPSDADFVVPDDQAQEEYEQQVATTTAGQPFSTGKRV